MVAEVARLHLQPASPSGVARALAGWMITLTGLAVLAAQALRGLDGFELPLAAALSGGAMAASATALGALPVLTLRKIGAGMQAMLLGFGAGVMLAASLFSLLQPAFAAAQAQGLGPSGAGMLVATGLLTGALLLLAMDRLLPHSHTPSRAGPSDVRNGSSAWLFVFAIAVHNIPEGLAIGVASGLGELQAGSGSAVATGISLQNVPEGLIVAIALAAAGYSRMFAFVVATASGLIEPIAAIAGSMAVSASAAILPWGLAAAAGAMLFVVSHEIIPESHRRGRETLATGGLILGFVTMMLLDGLLG